MENIIELINKRQEEVQESIKAVSDFISDPSYHSNRIREALADSIKKIDPEQEAVIQQLMGIINQVPQFIELGFSELKDNRLSLIGRFNELQDLQTAIQESAERDIRRAEDQKELLGKIESGEITEEKITGPRKPGERPESLATYRKVIEQQTKIKD